MAFDVAVQLCVNRAAKDFKRATLELEIRLVPNVDEFFYVFIFCLQYTERRRVLITMLKNT